MLVADGGGKLKALLSTYRPALRYYFLAKSEVMYMSVYIFARESFSARKNIGGKIGIIS